MNTEKPFVNGPKIATADDLQAVVEIMAMDNAERVLESYLIRQWDWSRRTFGPGKRTLGIVQHIQKELLEIVDQPDDLSEWIDVMILAMDGYWRHGGSPETLMADLLAKQQKNFARKWPPPQSEDLATEHIR